MENATHKPPAPDREWVKVIGHREIPGRPAIYGTTKQFLDYFNLKSLDELPRLAEVSDLDTVAQQLDLEISNDGGEAQSDGDASDEAEPVLQQADTDKPKADVMQLAANEDQVVDVDETPEYYEAMNED